MASRAEFLRMLESHLGEAEHPPGSDETIFNRFLGIGPGAWCMDFVSTSLWAIGNRDLAGRREARGTSYVPDAFRWAVRARRVVDFEHAQPGDGVIFVWGGSHSNPEGDHVGVLVSKAPLVTIEGNTHDVLWETRLQDRVMYRRDRSLGEVRAFVRFTFDEEDPQTEPELHPEPPWPGRVLTLRTPWMSGADVRMWQARMAERGYSVGVDGIYGPESERVCREFQAAKGLLVDGEVGPNTWHVTWSESAETTGANTNVRVMTGLDRSFAPSVDEARAIHVHTPHAWWGVYIGGPCYSGGWTPRAVHSLGAAGFRFVPIFVGQNDRSVCSHCELTAGRGEADAEDAARLLGTFGWWPHTNVPVCLDIEQITYERDSGATLEYAGAWVGAVRACGYVPGVYGSASCLVAVEGRPSPERPDWVWLARWNRRGIDTSLDPAHAPGLPAHAWQSRRGWQYAGNVAHLLGAVSAVDISCSTMPLALPP